jgi:hypothetical protein
MYHVPYFVILTKPGFWLYTTLIGCKIDFPFYGIIGDVRGGGDLSVEPKCLLRKKIYLKAHTDVFR